MLAYFLIFAAIVLRFIPHMPNFAAITAVAIFAGAYLPKKQAVALPLVARFVSDFLIGFFSWKLMIAVYASHLFGVVLGLWIKKRKSAGRVLVAPIFSSLVFFAVTNFAWFYQSYPHNLDGILGAYINGLPFLRGTLFGDLFYVGIMFGVYEWVRVYLTKKSIRFSIPPQSMGRD